MMHYVKSGDEKKRVTATSGTKKCRNCFTTPQKTTCYTAVVFVCHYSSPSIVNVSKQCSCTFTPAFSFMACTGTALTSSTLGYRNLKCRRVQKYGAYVYVL
jgi:hypothetical protein